MSDVTSFIFEGEPIGVLARGPIGFIFYAGDHRFNALDGRRFATERAVHRAARDAFSGQPRRRAPGIAAQSGEFRHAS